MKIFAKFVCAGAFATAAAFGTTAVWAEGKVWTPPKEKPYVQNLTEEVMKNHPEIASITFHGIPPGAPPKTYTMFGGSYLDRIGNPDDPDDNMVTDTGITILDPRWHRTKDAFKKYVVMEPLRTANGDNVGLLVIAYKADKPKTDVEYLKMGIDLRDKMAKKIPSFESLFQPAPK